jgi:hypothetical protein
MVVVVNRNLVGENDDCYIPTAEEIEREELEREARIKEEKARRDALSPEERKALEEKEAAEEDAKEAAREARKKARKEAEKAEGQVAKSKSAPVPEDLSVVGEWAPCRLDPGMFVQTKKHKSADEYVRPTEETLQKGYEQMTDDLISRLMSEPAPAPEDKGPAPDRMQQAAQVLLNLGKPSVEVGADQGSGDISPQFSPQWEEAEEPDNLPVAKVLGFEELPLPKPVESVEKQPEPVEKEPEIAKPVESIEKEPEKEPEIAKPVEVAGNTGAPQPAEMQAQSFVPDSQEPSLIQIPPAEPVITADSQATEKGPDSFVPETQGSQDQPDPAADAGQAAAGPVEKVATDTDMQSALQRLLIEFGTNGGAVHPYVLLPYTRHMSEAGMEGKTKFVVEQWKDKWFELDPYNGKTFSNGNMFSFKSHETLKQNFSQLRTMPYDWIKSAVYAFDEKDRKDNNHPISLLLVASFLTVSRKRHNVYIWKQNHQTKKLELWLHNPDGNGKNIPVDILVARDETQNKYHYFLLKRESA